MATPPSTRAVALQTSLFATVGVAAYVLRRITTPSLHPLVSEQTLLRTRHPALAASVSQLCALKNDDAFRKILMRIVEIAHLDESRALNAQWRISRLSADVVEDAKAMCLSVPTEQSEDLFRAVLMCTEEAVPQMQTHLDNLLHNHLLARKHV